MKLIPIINYPLIDVLANILEQDLPDELISNSSWLPDHIGNQKPPAQGPGPGGMQNGMDGADPNTIRQMQLNHIAQVGIAN